MDMVISFFDSKLKSKYILWRHVSDNDGGVSSLQTELLGFVAASTNHLPTCNFSELIISG